MPVGTLVLPSPANVRRGIMYGADGVEFTGTLDVPPELAAAITETADRLHEWVKRKLNPEDFGALPEPWRARTGKDPLETGQNVYPMAVVVAGPPRLLEMESDNRALVAYPFHVGLLVKEDAVGRLDPGLAAVRRVAQQAVHTTAYPAFAVEFVEMEEAAVVPWPGLDEGVTSSGFTVIIGVCEDRGPRAAGDPE